MNRCCFRTYWTLLLLLGAKVAIHIEFRLSRAFKALSAFFRRQALDSSRQLSVPPKGDSIERVRIVSLLCHRDVGMWLWAYHSWRQFSGLAAPVLILDDGSLTDADRADLRRFPEVEIVNRADADRLVGDYYRAYPEVLEYRRKTVLAPKIIDLLPLVPMDCSILLFDSDLVFFRRPDEVIALMRASGPDVFTYAQESGRTYDVLPDLLQRYPHLPPGFNSGLLLFRREWLQAESVARAVREVEQLPPLKMVYQDQILYLILAEAKGYRSLPASYTEQREKDPASGDVTMKHYHSWLKDHFALEGVWSLLRGK